MISVRTVNARAERPPQEPARDADARNGAAERDTVYLVTIGEALAPRTIQEALGESVSDVEVRLDQRAHFDQAAFLSRHRPNEADIEIWVDASDPAHLELYFVDRRSMRYALRTLALSGTMNEMDREALAQALFWSLRALRGGSTDTLDAAQATKILDDRARQQRSVPSNPDVSDKQADAAAKSEEETRPRPPTAERWKWAAALQYGATLHSTEIGIVHGPSVGATVEQRNTGTSWGARLTLQLQLPQSFADESVSFDLTTLAARLGVQVLTSPSARFRWGAVAGLGLDTAWITPRAGADPSFVTAAAPASFLPLPHASLLAELRATAHLLFELSLGIEGDLFLVHYDVIQDGVPERVVSRLPIRPTLTVGGRFP